VTNYPELYLKFPKPVIDPKMQGHPGWILERVKYEIQALYQTIPETLKRL
jgi:uncharacterized protein YcnI